MTFLESIGMRFGAERQRVHELRRDGLHAPGADRQAGRPRQGVPDPRGLGAQRLVRPGGDRQGARRRHRGMAAAAAAPARGCTTSSCRCCSRARATPSGCRSATIEIIQTFKHERLKKFYTDWYRPDLMAVVAVGDFDKAAIEGLIKAHFGTIPASPATKLAPVVQRPRSSGHALRDRHRQGSDVDERHRLQQAAAARSDDGRRLPAADGRAAVQRHAVDAVLGARAEAGRAVPRRQRRPRARSCRTKEVSTLSARVKDDGIERGLEALFTEAERVARFGFTATELDRQKRNILRGLERAVAEKDNQQSGAARRRVRAQLHRPAKPIPGIEYESGAAPAVPAGDHARRDQRAGEELGPRRQPRRRGQRAAEGRREDSRREGAGRGDRVGRRQGR